MVLKKVDKAAEIAIRDCMGAQEGEKILIVTDENKLEMARTLYVNAQRLGYDALMVEMKSRKGNGEEPPAEIAEMMKLFQIVFCVTTKSLTHTDARRNASAAGVRVASLPGITREVFVRGLSANYHEIAALSIKLKGILEKGKIIRVLSRTGTNLTMKIAGRKVIASKGLFHAPGESGNLPTGETYLSPVEGSSQGTLVIDGSMAGLGIMKRSVIRIVVKDGFATKITGGFEARKLIRLLSQYGPEAYNIAEFGIGTNPNARISGVVLEDEKVMGTVHVALGDNQSMGGSVAVPSHLDGVLRQPTFYMDEKLMMRDGVLLI